MTASPDGDALALDWSRLHPLSPVIQFGRAAFGVGVVLLTRLGVAHSVTSSLIDVAVLLVGLIAGFVHWLVTRWRVHGSELQIETGLIRRQSIRIPLSRIQSVDLVRPGLGRAFGLSEVRVELAGQGSGRGRLAYLPDDRANAVRTQLLALAHGRADTGERIESAPDSPLWAVDNGRLVLSALLGPPTLLLAALALGLAATAVWAPAAVGPVAASVVPLLVACVAAVGRRVVAEFGFLCGQAADGLRLHGGLIQTRSQTIPAGRVQAVRCTQPIVWRWLGWYRLEVDVARQRSGRRGSESDSRTVGRTLMPVGTASDVAVLLELVLPAAQWHPPAGARPQGRVFVKAPLTWAALASWHDDAYLASRTGRLRRSTVIVPLAKSQSVRWTQGPVQRRLRLATVRVDVAGRSWRAVARDRDVAEADALLQELPGLARAARA